MDYGVPLSLQSIMKHCTIARQVPEKTCHSHDDANDVTKLEGIEPWVNGTISQFCYKSNY